MARVLREEVQGLVERTKVPLVALDLDMLAHLEEIILAKVGTVYTTTTWVDSASTPPLIKTIISMKYASFHIDKAYAENQDSGNDYAARLDQSADSLLRGLVDGTITLPGIIAANPSSPSFYPNDASSAQQPTPDDMSLGPSKFSMGKVF